MAQTLTEIKQLLADHGLHPKKRFGQNFLHDGNQMRRIMEAAGVERDELIVEVGPGTGALSERLAEAGARLVCVEIDRELEPILQQRLVEPYGERVQLYFGDVLAGKHELNRQVVELIGGRPFKLVANLPYNVASPLLANLAIDHGNMTLAIVMIQKEVAERLTAGPGGKDYGPLTVIIGAMCEVGRVGVLSPSCFWPQPQVESAVVRMVRRQTALTDDPHGLSRLVGKLFSKRRKQLGTILGRERVLPAGIDAAARPETLTIEQLCELARQFG
jgi:16S rRNA (adenine1518-N6/adenine1519-N6)-dimethyltransferase